MKIVDRDGYEDGGRGISTKKEVHWGRQQNEKKKNLPKLKKGTHKFTLPLNKKF